MTLINIRVHVAIIAQLRLSPMMWRIDWTPLRIFRMSGQDLGDVIGTGAADLMPNPIKHPHEALGAWGADLIGMRHTPPQTIHDLPSLCADIQIILITSISTTSAAILRTRQAALLALAHAISTNRRTDAAPLLTDLGRRAIGAHPTTAIGAALQARGRDTSILGRNIHINEAPLIEMRA
ncbi:hypothetical protein KJ940_04630 [Myxococcota bacterium]|nr:hypothetical protein [Myxococcota bacterium]